MSQCDYRRPYAHRDCDDRVHWVMYPAHASDPLVAVHSCWEHTRQVMNWAAGGEMTSPRPGVSPREGTYPVLVKYAGRCEFCDVLCPHEHEVSSECGWCTECHPEMDA